jgi:hypothetical protein
MTARGIVPLCMQPELNYIAILDTSTPFDLRKRFSYERF